LLSHFNYVVVVILMMAGLFIVFSSGNLIKRMIGLAMFQTSTGLFYISAQRRSPAARRRSRLKADSELGEARTRERRWTRPMSRSSASMAWFIPIRCRTF
jgi:multisubunit Na+/H+ antiporter MnhC subunit